MPTMVLPPEVHLIKAHISSSEIRESEFTYTVTCPHCDEPLLVVIRPEAESRRLPTRAEQKAADEAREARRKERDAKIAAGTMEDD
jgi:hypothetical protein